MFKDIKDFLDKPENKEEILILDFQAFHGMDGKDHDRLVAMIKQYFGSKAASPRSLSPKSLAQDFWNANKQVIILRNNDRVTFQHLDTLWLRDKFIDSPWANITDVKTLASALTNELTNFDENKFGVLQGVLTPNEAMIGPGVAVGGSWIWGDGLAYSSLESVAKDVTPLVLQWVEQWKKAGVPKLNIVMVDHSGIIPNNSFVEKIKELNK